MHQHTSLCIIVRPERYLESMVDVQITQRLLDISSGCTRRDIKEKQVFGEKGETEILNDDVTSCSLRHYDDCQEQTRDARDHGDPSAAWTTDFRNVNRLQGEGEETHEKSN